MQSSPLSFSQDFFVSVDFTYVYISGRFASCTYKRQLLTAVISGSWILGSLVINPVLVDVEFSFSSIAYARS